MKNKFEIIWLILLFLTIFAYSLGEMQTINKYFVAILLITTFIKVQLVTDYFMDLHEVQAKYRFIPTVWLTIVISLIATAYYI